MVTHCMCGSESERLWSGLCEACYQLGCVHSWPIDFGTTIARFVRVNEVRDLRNALLGSAHNWRAMRRPEDDMERGRHWNALIASLNRLATLALGGR